MAKLATPPSLIVDAISSSDGFISIVMVGLSLEEDVSDVAGVGGKGTNKRATGALQAHDWTLAIFI